MECGIAYSPLNTFHLHCKRVSVCSVHQVWEDVAFNIAWEGGWLTNDDHVGLRLGQENKQKVRVGTRGSFWAMRLY